MDEDNVSIPEVQDRAISYLLASPKHMAALLRLAVPDLASRIDAGSLTELKSTLIPEDLRKVVEDVLYEGIFDGDADLSVLVLVAHQSAADPLMAYRIHGAMTRLNEAEQRRQDEQNIFRSEQRLRHVIPLVLHTGSSTPVGGPGRCRAWRSCIDRFRCWLATCRASISSCWTWPSSRKRPRSRTTARWPAS